MSTPTAPAPRSLARTLKAVVSEFRKDNLTDWAAALTYYSVLSLFPGLIVLVAILGLFGDPQATTSALVDTVSQIAPEATDVISEPVAELTANDRTAGIAIVVGIALALWSASGYVGAFARASNVIYEVSEGRPFWKLRPLQLAVTLVIVLLLALVALALVLTGPIVEAAGSAVGVSDAAVDIWEIAKWPVLTVVVMTVIAILFYTSPNVKLRGFRLVTPGSVTAVVLWLLASLGFAFYVGNFGSYDATYGSLGGVIVFLVWAWITNLALLLGAQLDAELERSREIAAGVPGAEETIRLSQRGYDSEERATHR